MKTQTPFTTPQILAMRQWFHKKKIKDLGSPLELSEAYVRDAIKDPEIYGDDCKSDVHYPILRKIKRVDRDSPA